jgi:hypothetical protein
MISTPLRRLWLLLQRLTNPAVCSVTITPAGLRCVRGRAPSAWLRDCADVGRELGVTRGSFDVVRFAGRLQLRFSPDLAVDCHQRLRNLLGLYRGSFG